MHDTPSTVSYTASGTATMFGVLTFNEWLALGGFVIAVLTFLFNVHHKREMRKIAREQGTEGTHHAD